MARMMLGVFSHRDFADNAINDLSDSGFNPKDISIIMKSDDDRVVTQTGSGIAEGAVSGAATGGLLGGLTGLLVGIGAIAMPGIGAVLIGGPIAAALGLGGAAATAVSGAVTGALAGGLVGALVGLGIPEEEARVYEDRIRQGAVLIAVPTSVRNEEEVRDILEAHHADQIRVIGAEERRDRFADEEDEHRHVHN